MFLEKKHVFFVCCCKQKQRIVQMHFFNSLLKQWSVLLCSLSRYASFHETAKADAVLGYLIAFLVLLATVKLWHLLRLNPKLHMITATLQRAWTDISGFLVVMTIMFLAYSIAVSSFPHLTSKCCWSLCFFPYFINTLWETNSKGVY